MVQLNIENIEVYFQILLTTSKNDSNKNAHYKIIIRASSKNFRLQSPETRITRGFPRSISVRSVWTMSTLTGQFLTIPTQSFKRNVFKIKTFFYCYNFFNIPQSFKSKYSFGSTPFNSFVYVLTSRLFVES